MFFRQVINEDLSCASYLVGDESAGVAVVHVGKGGVKIWQRLGHPVKSKN